MGFGSYDESEQRDSKVVLEEDDGEDNALHKHDHEGAISFDSGASTDDLLKGLAGILGDADEE